MTIASDLLRRHIETLVGDNAQWQALIADDLVWELVYGPSIGHPARLSGRDEVMRHLAWFLGAVEKFRFFDLEIHAFADPEERQSPRSKRRGSSSRRGASIARTTWCSCALWAARSRSCASTSIPCAWRRRRTRRFLVSSREEEAFHVDVEDRVVVFLGIVPKGPYAATPAFAKTTSPRDEDVRALVHEPPRGRKADAAIATGHERDFPFELAQRFSSVQKMFMPQTTPVHRPGIWARARHCRTGSRAHGAGLRTGSIRHHHGDSESSPARPDRGRRAPHRPCLRAT